MEPWQKDFAELLRRSEGKTILLKPRDMGKRAIMGYTGKHGVHAPKAATAEHATYITVTHGMSGYFAVMVWWNPDGFWEPYDSGIGRYPDKAPATSEARQWAQSENIKFVE